MWKAPGREVYNPVTREALVFPTSIATPAWFSLCYKSVEFGLYPPRLAYKSSSIFFHECEAGVVYVDFLCFLWQKRARERELDLFPLQKIALSDSFWRELFVSLSPVSTRECVVANWQSMSKQIRTMNRRRDNFLDFDQFTVRFKRGDYRKYVFFSFFILRLACKFVMLSRIKLVILLVHSGYAPINGMPMGRGGGRQGMGWGFDCLCWPWGRAFDWSCSPRGGDIWIFLRPTSRYLTDDSDEKDWDRTYVSFPTSTLHACAVRSVKMEIMEANENKRKLGGFHCFVSKFRLF